MVIRCVVSQLLIQNIKYITTESVISQYQMMWSVCKCCWLTVVVCPQAHVQTLEGVCVEDQVLLLSGTPLEDAATLVSCGVSEHCTLEVVGRLLGGKYTDFYRSCLLCGPTFFKKPFQAIRSVQGTFYCGFVCCLYTTAATPVSHLQTSLWSRWNLMWPLLSGNETLWPCQLFADLIGEPYICYTIICLSFNSV